MSENENFRSPDWKCENVQYLGLDGDRNLYVTFLAASEFIQTAMESGGKVLIHGVEGLNRSAAVIMAYIMSTTTSVLEDVFLYVKNLRPHLEVIFENSRFKK
jgi:protein-tyrosine phosphatase